MSTTNSQNCESSSKAKEQGNKLKKSLAQSWKDSMNVSTNRSQFWGIGYKGGQRAQDCGDQAEFRHPWAADRGISDGFMT
jgi:hypothetical protein